MRKLLLLAFVGVFLGGCLFIPQEAEEPGGVFFVDHLNLSQILWGTGEQFSFNEYSDLFRVSNNLFIDAELNSFSTQMFVARLRTMNREAGDATEYRWEASGSEPIFTDRPTTLNVRTFTISSPNSAHVETGRVRITVERTDFRWQITEWRELDEISFFHPTLGGSFGN
ncbi:MAG: hypothetical protein FWE23_01920 [Chitinivibrionia bacterium]|nr:hypothetical protein [Chitinivibrionia bacterium]